MNRHLAMILQWITAGIAMVLILIFGVTGNQKAIYIIGIITAGIMLYLSYQMRCRNCGRWPGKGGMWEEYCPRCGAHLDDE